MAVATEKPFKVAPESPSVVCRKRTIHQSNVSENDLRDQSCRKRKLNRAQERKVQFNLTNTQYIESPPSVPPASTWLPNEVYRTYHETSYKIAERIQQQANTFEPKYLSYESCIQRVLQTCLECSPELHPTDKVILWNWATIGDVRRGLEKLSVPHVAGELKRRKVGLISDILKLQNATVTSPCGKTVTAQEKAALFQRISQQYSKPSCLFAKALGKADEIAAKKEYKNGIHIQLPPPSSS
eukprot:CAMPEP_0195297436 /NCGR_PEP_ID=MMETSP0707-20130614/21505_1 /TAXON_ID=33640 /ORGANISM="Asterionellopsis glacialis, Strain CCMP134" /LENGTH=240 /DNA_ID=CAMNT_0040359245 /DNA_START=200 /DNA_END=922 /DNA_ORIENTATION=-